MKAFTSRFAKYARNHSSNVLKRFKAKFYRFRDVNFTLLDALAFPMTVDGWIRYSAVLNEILKRKNISSILEVGSGGEGVSGFLDGTKYKICVVDINSKFLQFPKKVDRVVCDGRKLPFINRLFDVVVTVDTIEHIPKIARASFIDELKRVSRKLVIIHTPLVNDDGTFNAKVCDVMFNQKHLERYGFEERNIAEHIKYIHPTLAELRKELPHAYFHGLQNCNTWYKYMLLRHSPLGLFAGLFYLLFLQKYDSKQPFYSCLIVYENEGKLS